MTAALPLSAAVFAELREIRRSQKVSAQVLADRMTAAGYPIQRTVIANCEGGRRAEISVDHLLVAAQVLGVDAVSILRRLAPCSRCGGEPPAGFTCNDCKSGGAPC